MVSPCRRGVVGLCGPPHDVEEGAGHGAAVLPPTLRLAAWSTVAAFWVAAFRELQGLRKLS